LAFFNRDVPCNPFGFACVAIISSGAIQRARADGVNHPGQSQMTAPETPQHHLKVATRMRWEAEHRPSHHRPQQAPSSNGQSQGEAKTTSKPDGKPSTSH
jgi:hypothetical protein